MFRPGAMWDNKYFITQKKAKILIADDDPNICKSTQAVLSTAGFETHIANDGLEAIAALNQGSYTLLLLDLDMPGANGFSVLEHINQHKISTGVIVVSGESDIKKALEVVKSGARDFVRKPHSADELILAINKVLKTINLENENREIFEELKRSEDLHRFIVHNSPDLMFMLDKRGELTFTNNMLKLLGYSDKNVQGKHYTEFIHSEDLARAKRYFGRGRSAIASKSIELRLVSNNQRQVRHVEVTTIKVSKSFADSYRLSDNKRPQKRRLVGFYGVARDITDQKRSEEIIRYQHNHDILTGLPNRRLLNERLSMLIDRAQKEDSKVAVLFIDIDRFKLINDSFGQVTGDELLQAVSESLKRYTRKEDTLARFGGDEFVLLLPQVKSAEDAASVARKIIREIAIPFHLNGHEIHITASMGISIFPEHGDAREELIKNADTAVCNSRNTSISNFCIYNDQMTNHNSNKVRTENRIRSAIRDNRLLVHYQPQINLQTGQLHAAEALVRIFSPENSLILPGHFITIAEESNLINELGQVVLKQVFQDVQEWQAAGMRIPVSINISAKQLALEDFSDSVLTMIGSYGLDPKIFELELTENVLIQNLERTLTNLTQLTRSGIKIAIDDFGKGYSSLSYLDQLPLHTLKLDKSFMKNIRTDKDENTIIPAIINVAQGLKLKFIAEGVESKIQHHFLRAQGSCIAQGFYYSKPIDKNSLVDFVKNYSFSNFD